MKSKDRVTIMVCTDTVEGKVPLTMVGKSKDTCCLSLSENGVGGYSIQ